MAIQLNFSKVKADEIEAVFSVFYYAINNMNSAGIDQWDDNYPTMDIIKNDIRNNQMYVGKISNEIAVVFVLNSDCDEEYKNGNWNQDSEPYMVVHRLCVHPKFQNLGIGKMAMLYIENNLCDKKAKSIRLDAFSQNPYVIRLYHSIGYKTVGYAVWRKGEFHLMEKLLCQNKHNPI